MGTEIIVGGLLYLALSMGCGIAFTKHATREPRYKGKSYSPIAEASGVESVDAIPEGFVKIGNVEAECPLWEYVSNLSHREALSGCTRGVLMDRMKSRAAESGGLALLIPYCSESQDTEWRPNDGGDSIQWIIGLLGCDADVLRPQSGIPPERENGFDRSASGQQRFTIEHDGGSVEVILMPSAGGALRPATEPGSIERLWETLAKGDVIGMIRTRCVTVCLQTSVEWGLKVGAGRLGANVIADQRCLMVKADVWECQAVAGGAEE